MSAVRRPASSRDSFADDTARTDLSDDLAVDPYLEDAVEDEHDRRGLLVLAKQEVARVQLPYRRRAFSHDVVGERPFELRLGFGDVRRLVIAAPRRVAAERGSRPDLIAGERGLLDEVTVVVVQPMARERACSDELSRWWCRSRRS